MEDNERKKHMNNCISYQALCKLTTYVSPSEKKRVKNICERTGQNQSALVCDAVRFYLKDLDSKNKY